MTDKEVIDGVEASKCENIYKVYGYCDMGIIENRPYSPYLTSKACCSDNPNCYYKQLQRKTQECEKLKEENKQYKHLAEQHLKDYFECYKALEEIEEFCLVYRDNPVEGSAYKKILDIITKEKEQE